MKKLVCAGLVMVFLAGSVFAAGQKNTGGVGSGGLAIAGIYKAGDQTWFLSEGKSSEAVIVQNGGTFMYMDAKMEASTYMKLIDTCIAQKVKGVLVCIPDQNLSQVTVQKLKEANIPVVACDDPLQDETGKLLAPWVGIDAYNIGKQVGVWAADYIRKNNLADDPGFGIMYMTCETVSSIVPRTQGQSEEIMKAFPNFPASRIFKADSDATVENGNVAAAAVIVGNPQIKKWLVFGINDEVAQGASRALEAAGLASGSLAIGLGGYLAIDEFTKKDSPFKAAAYFSARDVGSMAAQSLVDFIQKGTPIPERQAVGAHIIVVGDDLRTIMPEYF